jgi:hypothetical protein
MFLFLSQDVQHWPLFEIPTSTDSITMQQKLLVCLEVRDISMGFENVIRLYEAHCNDRKFIVSRDGPVKAASRKSIFLKMEMSSHPDVCVL